MHVRARRRAWQSAGAAARRAGARGAERMKEAGNSRLRRAAPLCKFGGGQPAGASRTSASVAAPRDPRALVSKCLLSLRLKVLIPTHGAMEASPPRSSISEPLSVTTRLYAEEPHSPRPFPHKAVPSGPPHMHTWLRPSPSSKSLRARIDYGRSLSFSSPWWSPSRSSLSPFPALILL